ncbi:hypothetical protein B0H63DRAFT_217626 [Podospora didyma]|uniref:Uncharacterized protein n=1 Tax=Podospora didyma TaxID=330526 RepID=A0AAE0NI65_9PEZI|nr:hypothetical protein B0H63DRAFT_217626 [Podospora didyma]
MLPVRPRKIKEERATRPWHWLSHALEAWDYSCCQSCSCSFHFVRSPLMKGMLRKGQDVDLPKVLSHPRRISLTPAIMEKSCSYTPCFTRDAEVPAPSCRVNKPPGSTAADHPAGCHPNMKPLSDCVDPKQRACSIDTKDLRRNSCNPSDNFIGMAKPNDSTPCPLQGGCCSKNKDGKKCNKLHRIDGVSGSSCPKRKGDCS